MPPVRVSLMGKPVCCSAVRMSATEAVGAAWRSTANAPVTNGVDIDVPLATA